MFDAGTYVTLLGKSQFVTLHDAICSRAYGKSALLSCWVDLLHFDYIETNVSHAPPRNPICGILVARESRCETWLHTLTS